MLSEREYLRGATGRSPLSLTLILVVVNVLIFLAEKVADKYSHGNYLEWLNLLALSVPGLKSWHLWQLFTFQFLHGGWLHLILNCWALYVFGQELEENLGRVRFLKLYLFSGVIGGLIQLLCAVLASRFFGEILLGASAGVFGLIAAYAALFPERELTLLLFFVIPVTLRAKTLLFWGAAIAIIGALFPRDNVAHAAHLGGMLGGLVYLNLMRPNRPSSGAT